MFSFGGVGAGEKKQKKLVFCLSVCPIWQHKLVIALPSILAPQWKSSQLVHSLWVEVMRPPGIIHTSPQLCWLLFGRWLIAKRESQDHIGYWLSEVLTGPPSLWDYLPTTLEVLCYKIFMWIVMYLIFQTITHRGLSSVLNDKYNSWETCLVPKIPFREST